MNKESKKGDRYRTAILLETRLGALDSTKSANKNASASTYGPLCAGLYNSSNGQKVYTYKIYIGCSIFIFHITYLYRLMMLL